MSGDVLVHIVDAAPAYIAALILGFLMYYLEVNAADSRRAKENKLAEELRQQFDRSNEIEGAMLEVVKNNTEALTTLTGLVKSMHVDMTALRQAVNDVEHNIKRGG